jgi:hypothetical protein
MMLSARGHKHTCAVEKTVDGRLRVNVNRGDPDRPSVDFNFLVTHAKTGRGLYMHYYQSCSFDRFSGFCRESYEDLKQELISAKRVELGDDTRAEKKATKAFAGTLRAKLLVRSEKLADMIAKFNDITRLDITAVELQKNEPWASPDVEVAVKHVSHRFSFIRDVPAARQRAAAARLIEAMGARRGKVVGTDDEGEEQIFKLSRNVDSFGDFPFDHIAERMVFDPKDLASSDPVREIVKAAGENKAYFETGG